MKRNVNEIIEVCQSYTARINFKGCFFLKVCPKWLSQILVIFFILSIMWSLHIFHEKNVKICVSTSKDNISHHFETTSNDCPYKLNGQ